MAAPSGAQVVRLRSGDLVRLRPVRPEDRQALARAYTNLGVLSREIVGECRYIRLSDRPDTADLAVTVVDAWQGRGLGSVLLARLSARALKAGIVYFSAEVLAENRSMLTLLPRLGRVESESSGTVGESRIKLAVPRQ